MRRRLRQSRDAVPRDSAHYIPLREHPDHIVPLTDDQGADAFAVQFGAGLGQGRVGRQSEDSLPLALEYLGDQHGGSFPFQDGRRPRTGRYADRIAQSPA
ncbi:hypothetical protein D3C87_1694970 [compost metagenome]